MQPINLEQFTRMSGREPTEREVAMLERAEEWASRGQGSVLDYRLIIAMCVPGEITAEKMREGKQNAKSA